tara:strand:+ start:3353 stop:4780 length:1428 start_codon:yes stop_codon:yes gene_type:complete
MDDKTLRQIEGYLEELDETKTYPSDFLVLIFNINRLINIPIRTNVNGKVSAEPYTLSYLLSKPGRNELGFDFEAIDPYIDGLTKPENLEIYIDSLKQFLTDAVIERESTASTGDTYQIQVIGDLDTVDSIQSSITDWNTATTQEQSFTVDNPKVPGIYTPPVKTIDPETGQTRFSSYEYYSGPNMAINESNQYIDPETGGLKKDSEGNVLRPVFRAGAASAMFEGLSQEAIFEIQKELIDLGLDPSQYAFNPGVIDFSATSGEIDFVARLMTQANDANAMFPTLNLIDKDSDTLMGMLRPFLDYKKTTDTNTNAFIESLSDEFAGEIVPPTEAEIKSIVDKEFASRGLYATANDYGKYATIFSNLKKDAATRQAEIEKNKPSLGDVIGLSKTFSQGATEGGMYTYPGFGITTPTAEETRKQLGKPLLQPIDPVFELGKIIDNIEAGRIDASQEIVGRQAAATEFKRNFMVFEENF